MLVLRDYQQQAIDCLLASLVEEQSALCVAPTASGKTEIMIGLMKEILSVSPNAMFSVIIKRISLVEQTDFRFREHGLPSKVFCSTLNKKEFGQITVSSVDSIHSVTHHADYVILDEAHNLNYEHDVSRYALTIKRLKDTGSKFIGFTATPFRSNGYIYGDEKLFPKISYEIGFKYLIDKGYLVKPVSKSTENSFDMSSIKTKYDDWDESALSKIAEDESKLKSQVTEALAKTKDRFKIFWQAININHAERIAAHIRSLSGDKVSVVHYKTERRVLEEFEKGDARHCVFIFQLSEGYNYPPADALVMLRPTRSPVLYVQTVGRVLRTHPGKKDALILDFGEIVKHCGPIDRPMVRQTKGPGQKKEANEILVWICDECLTYNDLELDVCSCCNKEKKKQQKEPDKNTTITSSESDLLSSIWGSTDLWSIEVETVTLEKHVSKSGNPCIRINYVEKTKDFILGSSFSSGVISEYFSLNSEYAKMLLRKRASTLGILGASNIDKKTRATNIPRRVFYKLEKGYKKVVTLDYGS
jgi:DNA repair protein RadD